MTLTKHTVYHHEDLGDVLGLGVHHIFETYDPESADGHLRSRVVRYPTEWDDYGPMPTSIRTTPVEEFRAVVGNVVRAWDEATSRTDSDV